MLTAGIVCEYNPFHNGHLYQMEKTRALLGENTALVCVMSGDFVQRGEAAVFDKFARSEAAVRCGADLVLELPLPWCLSSAEGFARGAVGLLGALGVTALSFGSETGELKALKALAVLLADPAFTERVKARLASEPNLSFAAAREQEAALLCGDEAKLLEQPNNILAIEYLKAMHTLGLSMRPLAIKREGSGHDQPAAQGALRSASEIRRLLREGRDVTGDIPAAALAVYRRETAQGRAILDTDRLETAMLSRLRQLREEDCMALPDTADGLGRRLYRAIRTESGLNQICLAAKSKRYALARIRRMALCACLGVRDGMAAGLPPYARPLAMNGRGRALLREISGTASVPILTKPAAVHNLGGAAEKIFILCSSAHDFYALGCGQSAGIRPEEDWRKSPVIV
ncbi:MAG: nucleotidyltransferase family protein [Oscillospiraceae bacterium]|nr:nucleotidyltransferase family protein [Oscillospiraceae bacterium]